MVYTVLPMLRKRLETISPGIERKNFSPAQWDGRPRFEAKKQARKNFLACLCLP
ncbi:Hypothetical protein Minf_2175 [Methylacidiphilum infernorum V4]|uniref:Uncharacterized protein n=2 Tax=Candidatus Methylacidiphilum infernorum TaxID=511746 RepID=B3DZP4_METI4|nr:Hypothetical protein Minf_2175 [Methylacidiphilum infernorum V4]